MTISLSVRDLPSFERTFREGTYRVAVMGILVVSDGLAEMIDDFGADEAILGRLPSSDHKRPRERKETNHSSSVRVLISDDSFLPQIRSAIPGSGGSAFEYFDVAMICGRICIDGDAFTLQRISNIVIYRDGITYESTIDEARS
ncbi:MAG: hypothetical protein ACK6AT_19420 [Planctomycetota bacterium]|jgi:hypothetical protein